MSNRFYFDTTIGMTRIRRSDDARHYASPAAMELWSKTGIAPDLEEVVEELRCPTCGRTEQCCCPDCPYCDPVTGVPGGRVEEVTGKSGQTHRIGVWPEEDE